MKLVIQRVSEAAVAVDKQIVGQINKGYMVLVGITHTDNQENAKWLANKLINMRLFSDAEDKMNLAIKDVGGEILAISQFTLYGDAIKGNRPSFINAARPDIAKQIYEYFIEELKSFNIKVEQGIFGADMKVNLINDGPVTIILEK